MAVGMTRPDGRILCDELVPEIAIIPFLRERGECGVAGQFRRSIEILRQCIPFDHARPPQGGIQEAAQKLVEAVGVIIQDGGLGIDAFFPFAHEKERIVPNTIIVG